MLLAQAWAYKRFTSSSGQIAASEELIGFLGDKGRSNVLTQPRHKGSKIAWRNSQISVADFLGDGKTSFESLSEMKAILGINEFYRGDIEKIDEIANPDWVVFDKSNLDSIPEGHLRPPQVDPDFENDWYSVYNWSSLKR
jgi:hypothetical protein